MEIWVLQFNEISFECWFYLIFIDEDENVDKFQIKFLKPISKAKFMTNFDNKSQSLTNRKRQRNKMNKEKKHDEIFLINWAFQLQKERGRNLLLTHFIFLSHSPALSKRFVLMHPKELRKTLKTFWKQQRGRFSILCNSSKVYHTCAFLRPPSSPLEMPEIPQRKNFFIWDKLALSLSRCRVNKFLPSYIYHEERDEIKVANIRCRVADQKFSI